MYKCTLHIKIFTNDPLLAEVIDQLPPLEHFDHSVETVSEWQEGGAKADILLADLEQMPNVQALRHQAGPQAIIVLCLATKARLALTAEQYQYVDEVWPKPLNAAFVRHAFARIQRLIKLNKDHILSQVYLDTAMDSIPDLVWFKDVRGAHLKVNESFCKAVGKTKKDVEGRGHYYIWDLEPEEYAQGEYVCLETEETVLRERKTCLFDEKVKSKQGLRQFKTYKSPLFFDDGQLMGTVGIAQDVTDLANRGAELEIILRNMPFGLMVCDFDNRIINVNGKFEEYFNCKGAELRGMEYGHWRATLHSSEQQRSPDFLEVSIAAENEQRLVELHEEPILDVFGNQVGQFTICRDVTIERAYEQQMKASANTDPLTALYNRRYLYEFVEQNRGDQPMSMLYIDLDNFKQVNDRYGHKVGDDALNFMARLLHETFPDDLAARLGGDEFVICILGPVAQEELEARATLMLETSQKQFLSNECLLHVSISIGIASAPDTSMSLADLIRNSDAAMYQAKRMGKARYCVYNENCDKD